VRERDIEAYLVNRVQSLGGEIRKVNWIGRRGAPDRCVMLDGKTIFIELKAPGVAAEPHQLREHARMRKMGQRVEVIDSLEGVEALLCS
jgi:hypothetical protein